MVFMLPEKQGALDFIAKSLGTGLGQGIEQGLQSNVQNMLKEKERISKGRPKVLSSLKGLLSFVDKNESLDETVRGRLLDEATKEFESNPGLDPFLAVTNTLERFRQNQALEEAKKPPKQSFGKRVEEDIKAGAAKAARPLVGVADIPIQLGQGLGDLITQGIQKLRGLSPEQIQQQEKRNDNLPKPLIDQSLLKKFDELTGGRGVPQNAVEQIVSGFPAGIPGMAFEAGGELAKGLGFGELGQLISGLGGLTGAVKAGMQMGPVFNALAQSIKRVPAASKALSEASKVANIPEEQIVEKAIENLESRGVNVLKTLEGDASATNDLQKEVNKVAKTFQTAEKQNVKELQKVREDVAKKLPESPLEKYYEVKPEKVSRPETILAEEERIKPLKAQVAQKERSLRNLQYEILNTDSALRNTANLTEENIARLTAKRRLDALQHERTLADIRNLEFEMKYKRPPMTTEQIQKQIGETFDKLREGIKNPTAEKVEAFRKGIERDRAAIAQAEKLAARGEIPGPEVFDEYIKIHQEYNKAYGDLQKELKDFIKENKANKKMAKQVANAEALNNVVADAQRAGEAKVSNQIDKRRATRAIDKPASGAFYRQMLKDLRKDVDAFQRNFFKWKQIKSPVEEKAAKTASEALKKSPEESAKQLRNIANDAKEAVEKPTAQNINNVAKEVNASPEEVKGLFSQVREFWKKAQEKVKTGKATEKDASNLFRSTMNKFNRLPKLPRAIIGGLVLGTIQGLAEEYFGYKPSGSELTFASGFLVKGGLPTKAGTGVVAAKVFSFLHDMFNDIEADKLRSYRNTNKYNEHLKDLRNRYSTRRVNEIIELATSKKSA